MDLDLHLTFVWIGKFYLFQSLSLWAAIGSPYKCASDHHLVRLYSRMFVSNMQALGDMSGDSNSDTLDYRGNWGEWWERRKWGERGQCGEPGNWNWPFPPGTRTW